MVPNPQEPASPQDALAFIRRLQQEFKTCLTDRTHQLTVKRDLAEADADGVHATPTFFIKTQVLIVNNKPNIKLPKVAFFQFNSFISNVLIRCMKVVSFF